MSAFTNHHHPGNRIDPSHTQFSEMPCLPSFHHVHLSFLATTEPAVSTPDRRTSKLEASRRSLRFPSVLRFHHSIPPPIGASSPPPAVSSGPGLPAFRSGPGLDGRLRRFFSRRGWDQVDPDDPSGVGVRKGGEAKGRGGWGFPKERLNDRLVCGNKTLALVMIIVSQNPELMKWLVLSILVDH